MSDAQTANTSLDRDDFVRVLSREVTRSIEDALGLEEAAGSVSLVGRAVGRRLNAERRTALAVPRLSPDPASGYRTRGTVLPDPSEAPASV